MTSIVKRLDQPITAKTKRMDDGSMVCEARIARAGIYTYVLPSGEVSKEYRAPDEVFKPDALLSFETAPLTLNHPAVGEVNPSNYRQETRGVVTNVRQDAEAPEYVAATVRIQDAQALAAVADGTVQLSCGYTCTRTPVTGMTVTDAVTGETCKIDAVLSQIEGNHVAIVPAGRAGPGARLILDAQDFGVEMQITVNDEIKPLKCADCDAACKPGEPCPNCGKPVAGAQEVADGKIAPARTIGDPGQPAASQNGNEKGELIEAPAEVIAGGPPETEEPPEPVTLTPEQIKALEAELQAARGEVAKYKAKLEELSLSLAKQEDPAFLDSLVAERSMVVAKAHEHGIKTDAMPTADLRKAVLTKAFPKMKLDSFNSEQLSNLFDSVVSPVEVAPAPKAETTVVVKLEASPIDAAKAETAKRYGANTL